MVTQKDTNDLFMSEKGLRNYVGQLDTAIHQDHYYLRNLTSTLKQYDLGLSQVLASSASLEKNVTLIFQHLRQQTIQDLAKENQVVHSALLMLLHGVINHIRILQQVFRLNIIDSCREGRIPPVLLTPVVFAADLRRLATAVAVDGRQLVISPGKVHSYYKLNIATCVIAKDSVLVTVRVPIRSRNHEWRLYEPLFVPFAWEGRRVSYIVLPL